VADRVEVLQGAALESLAALKAERAELFDFVFIDADKANIPHYFTHALELTRVGGVIVVDNVVRDGRVIDTHTSDASVQGVRRFNEMVATEKRVSATALQTVGVKGYDGLAIMLIVDPATA
jgi:predicted O-methyltransferase YrrM